uniref:C2H2-type domain-containing protein n=1 Tax=Buteo japonicus TaxID=224669 RepID=A0A8C0AQG3_9AVES
MALLYTNTIWQVLKAVFGEVPVTGGITAWILVTETEIILVSSQGKKHAQKVRLYIQMHGKKDERQEDGKQKKTDLLVTELALVWFQMDGSGVVDRNKYCNLCNMFFTSPIVALSHYLGKIHAKKLKQLSPSAEKPLLPSKAEESSSSSNTRLKLNDPDKYCKLCCAPFNNPLVAQQHYVGKKHRRNEARKKILEELGDKAVPAESSSNAVGVGYYMCSICNITLTSIETYQSHVQGNKHRIKDVKDHLVPTPLPWAGTPSTRPGCSKPHPTWP